MSKITTTTPKATIVRTMKFEDLKLVAKQLDIEVSVDEKKWVVLETVLNKLAQLRETESNEVQVSVQLSEIAADQSLSKSDKIRAMFAQGAANTIISKLCDAHYSFVHTVVGKHKIKLATEALEVKVPTSLIQAMINENVLISTSQPVVEQITHNPEIVEPVNFDGELLGVPVTTVKKKRKTAAERMMEEVYA